VATTLRLRIGPPDRGGSRSRFRERARQDRGEPRAQRPRGHALTRRSPRPLRVTRRDTLAASKLAAASSRHTQTTLAASCADATLATASAPSQARATTSRDRSLPSDLPDASQSRRRRTARRSARGAHRRVQRPSSSAAAPGAPPARFSTRSRRTDVRRGARPAKASEPPSVSKKTSRTGCSMPCTRMRDGCEHRHRAREPLGSRSGFRERARQDRGESRAQRPRGHAQTRRSPRPLRVTRRDTLAASKLAAASSRHTQTTLAASCADATLATASAPSQARATTSRERSLP
jgi:hypothetical protein